MTLSPRVTWPSAAMTTLAPRRTQMTVVERMRRSPERDNDPTSGPPDVLVENRRGDPAGGVTTGSFMLSSLYAPHLTAFARQVHTRAAAGRVPSPRCTVTAKMLFVSLFCAIPQTLIRNPPLGMAALSLQQIGELLLCLSDPPEQR